MSIQPLQRAPKVACSVASLSPVSGHQLREQLSLHCGVLAGYLLGKGQPSACLTIHGMDHYNPASIVTEGPNLIRYLFCAIIYVQVDLKQITAMLAKGQ